MPKNVKTTPKTTPSIDDQLTEYLRQAEEALIGAVKLFCDEKKLNRRVGYLSRLVQAQEAITGLFREELVRERGPQKLPRGRKGVKRK